MYLNYDAMISISSTVYSLIFNVNSIDAAAVSVIYRKGIATHIGFCDTRSLGGFRLRASFAAPGPGHPLCRNQAHRRVRSQAVHYGKQLKESEKHTFIHKFPL